MSEEFSSERNVVPFNAREDVISAGRQDYAQSSGPTPEAEGPKVNYLALMRARKWWILLAAVIGCVGGVVYCIFRAPAYEATAMVELVGFNESFMGLSQFDPEAGTGANSATIVNLQTQLRILTSASLRGRVIQRVALETTPTGPASTDFFSKIRNRFGLLPQEPTEFTQMSIRAAAKTLSVQNVGMSKLLNVSCQSPSPEIAAAFTNAIANEYVNQNAVLRTSSASRTSQWLESQLEETKTHLDQANTKLQDFIKKEGLAFVLDQNTLADTKVKQLQQDLSVMQAERVSKQSRYELAKSSPIDSLPEILDDGTLRGLRDQLTGLRRDRAQLLATLTPAHYRVQKIDAQIAEIEQTLQREKGNLVKRIENEYDAALRREKLMAGAYAAQSRALADQADKSGTYTSLKHDVEQAQQSYNVLLQQYNQAALATAVPANNVRVVDPASVPSVVLTPEPMKDIPIGTLVGSALAALLLIVLEKLRLRRLSQVFAAPGHLAPVLNIPELGVIPSIAPVISRAKSIAGIKLSSLSRNDENNRAHTLMTSENSESFLADSFRYALTSLLARQSEREHLTLLVTSPGAGEGKTTLAGNLAVATAQTGRSVLLIDGDLRRARLHELFEMSSTEGFADILSADADKSPSELMPYIQRTSVHGLSLLASGTINSEQLLGAIMFSPRLPHLLARLRKMFDIVLIDTPPALQFPDARLLGQLSDGVILIVRSGVTFRRNALAAAERFSQDGVPILGTILNDWDPAATPQDGNAAAHRYSPYDYADAYRNRK